MTWQNRLSQADSKLTVSLRKFTDISKGTDSSVASKERSNVNSTTVEFEDTFFASAFYFDSRSSQTSKANSKEAKSALSRQYHSAVDNYLAHNPCWIPLYEPPLQLFRSGREFVIFARLPDRSFHATCKLYTSIVNRQFPRVCNYDPSHLAAYELPNIGYNHVITMLTKTFISILQVNKSSDIAKVFTAPTASMFLSRANNSIGSDHKINPHLWSWADPKICPHDTFANDPWACNFIAFTNCSNRVLSVNSTKLDNVHHCEWGGIVAADNDTVNGTVPLAALRDRYNESFELTNGQWFQSRMYAFLQRPNAQLRRELRVSLRAIRQLAPTAEVTRRLRMLSASNYSGQFELPEKASTAGDTFSPGGVVRLSCLAMHVRHGDAALDMRRHTNFSRTLRSHVAHARNLTLQLGLNSIFLATDNSTVVKVATTEHKEYRWYNQQRPMTNISVLYMMFTETLDVADRQGNNHSSVGINGVTDGAVLSPIDPLDSDDDQRSMASKTGGSTFHSVQKDLSHVLADLRFASQCPAMVGSFDSGFTQLMRAIMCSIRNKCPLAMDLRDSKFLPPAEENW